MRGPTLDDLFGAGPNNLNFLRLLLATCVIYSHSFPLLRGESAHDPLSAYTGGRISLGGLAVNLFFTISGFLIANSWLRGRGLGDFLKKRILRIYPGFVVASAFSFFVVGAVGAENAARYFDSLPVRTWVWDTVWLRFPELRGVFLQAPIPNAVNGSLWTIPLEFHCYVMTAALGLLTILRRPAAVLLIFLGSFCFYAMLNRFNFNRPSSWLYHVTGFTEGWPRLLAYFLAGTAFHAYRRFIPHSMSLAACSATLVLTSVIVAKGMHLVLPLFGSYLLFYIAFSRHVHLQRVGANADFSYGLYLYAFPVQQMLVAFSPVPLNPSTFFVLSTIATVPLAVASWYLVESPALRFKPVKPTPESLTAPSDAAAAGGAVLSLEERGGNG